jgi:hypothetical protein
VTGFVGRLGDARYDVVADSPLIGHPENRARRVLARKPQHDRRERRQQDRQLQVGDVEVVVDAVDVVVDVDSARSCERSGQDLQIVAHEMRGPLVGKPEHVGDDPVMRRAGAEHEPALTRRLRRQRLLCHRDRMTRLERDDGGADLEPLRVVTDERCRGHGIEVVRVLRDPDRGEPGLLGGLAVGDELRDLLAIATALRADVHADAHLSEISAIL